MSARTAATHLILPFAGHASPACQAALAQLRLPRLEALLARWTPAGEDRQDGDSLSPPHERVLAAAHGIAAPDGRLPWAALAARAQGLPGAGPDEGWGWITLCHWQVGLSEVVLDDPLSLAIDAHESASLLEAMQPFFAEDGIDLHPSVQPGRWLAHSPVFSALSTASIDRAASQPIAHWLPRIPAMQALLRLQNEMQMLLYTHPVNDARSARGAPPLNSFWLSGTGALPASPQPTEPLPTLDMRLREAALRDDGAAWAQAWHALDAGPLAHLLAASHRDGAARLTLCGDCAARTFASPGTGLFTRMRGWLSSPHAASVLENL